MGELVRGDCPLGDLPRDASLLVEGPPMTGKYTLLLTILAHYTEEAIVISTKHTAERVGADFQAVGGSASDGRLGVVDCVPRPARAAEPDSELVKVAGSPENLTRIGVSFTELFEEFYAEGSSSSTGVGLHSVSQLLMHAGIASTYQFLQVLTGQVHSADWLFAAVVDANVDQEDLQTLYQHFDGVVQTRENDQGRREFRLRGMSPTVSEWSEF